MPELPEVETIARQLDRVLKGQTIQGVEVRGRKGFPHFAKATRGKGGIIGKRVVRVWRRAKMAIVELASSGQRLASSYLLVHLKMTGQLIYQKSEIRNQKSVDKIRFVDPRPHFKVDGRIVGGHPTLRQGSGQASSWSRIVGGHPTADWVADLPNKHTRVVLQLTKGILFFNDQRMFGWMKIVNRIQLEKELEKYGPDITDRVVTGEYFSRVLQSSRRAVKLVITDQAKVAGVGNIYANDGLWCAQIRPQRVAREINRAESERLLSCLRKVIQAGIKYGGATASDDKFVQTTGLGGKYQEHFLVYEQAGKKCQRRGCGGTIKKVSLGGRGTYFCPVCQS